MDRKIIIAAARYKAGCMSLVSFLHQVKIALVRQKRDIDTRSVTKEAMKALEILKGRI